MFCSKCEKVMSCDSEDLYCYECGSELDDLAKCGGCEAQMLPFEKFCSKCGVKNNHPQNG